MRKLYVDESGFTGEDLLNQEQPVFVQATNDFSDDEARNVIAGSFPSSVATELKFSRLIKYSGNHDGIVNLIKAVAVNPNRAGYWVAHKEYAMLTQIVEWWIEPLAYKFGQNLYKDGANHALANLLYYTLESFWGNPFRRKVLISFQQMFRTKSLEKFFECQKLIEREFSRSSGDLRHILSYLYLPFSQLGYQHIQSLRPRILDVALPGLIRIGHEWRKRQPGEFELVHDQSSNMAKQRWLWDAISSPTLGEAEFEAGDISVQYPINVAKTRFADSITEKRLQICDILAGAASWLLRDLSSKDPLKSRLLDAGLENLCIDGIWPRPDVTPEALGKKGQDLNEAVDWLSARLGNTGGEGS